MEASVVVEAKMEREEISTSDIGPEFSIDFRQELALFDRTERVTECSAMWGTSTLPRLLAHAGSG